MASFTQTYSEVIWPDRRRALGKVLLPVTIERALLLWRLQSPFIAGAKVASQDSSWAHHVSMAVFALSRSCIEAAEAVRTGRARRLLKLWRWQIWLRGGLEGASEQISAHIDEAFSGPALWEKEGGAKCGAPYLQWLKCSLMECFGTSRSEALEYSVREAIWDLACYAEAHERAEWVSADLLEALDRRARN